MPFCSKHGHIYGDGCKCPDCEKEATKGKAVDVPVPEDGEHNPESGFLEHENEHEKETEQEHQQHSTASKRKR